MGSLPFGESSRRGLRGMAKLSVVATVALCLLSTASQAARTDVVLVERGQPAATIVIGQKAGAAVGPIPAELMPPIHEEMLRSWARTPADAAKELQTYIHKVSGAELPIVTDDRPVKGTLILVGESKYTRQMGLTNDSFSPQEYLIRAEGDRLVLMGRDESFEEWILSDYKWRGMIGLYNYTPLSMCMCIGTDYAVDSFLERFCGIRWYFPSEIGEVVPERSTIAIPETEIRRQPETRSRIISPDMMLRKYYWEDPPKGVTGSFEETRDWGRRLKLGGEMFRCNHSLYGYHDRFAKEHPDWWGSRPPAPGLMLCLSNPGLFEQVVQDARDAFDGKDVNGVLVPGRVTGDYFAVVPMDSPVETWCQCDECKAQYKGPVASNYVWGFVAKVADEIAKTHPVKNICCVAYWNYIEAPDEVKLPGNVAVQICGSIPPPEAQKARQFWEKKIFLPWTKVADPSKVYVWSYWQWPLSPDYIRFPDVNPRGVGETIRFMRQHDFRGGIKAQIDEGHVVTWSYPVLDHIRVYTMAKMLDDWSLNETDIVEEYYRLFYGPALEPMRTFWEFINNAPYDPAKMGPLWRREKDNSPEYHWTVICSPKELKALGGYLEEARRMVPEDSVYRKRIDLVDEAAYKAYLVRASRQVLGAEQ